MSKFLRINTLSRLSRLPQINTLCTCRLQSSSAASSSPGASGKQSRNNSSSTTVAPDGESNKPIAYFGSAAAKWTARQGQSGGVDENLWYQPLVVSGSLAVFLIYFCVLREESDIDNKLEGSLYDHVAGLEETQIQLSYNYNKEHGLSTEALEKRMTELGMEKAAK